MGDALSEMHPIELLGRLVRSDRRPASPGDYELLFRLHPSKDGDTVLWEERHQAVEVLPGGFFHVLLGSREPLGPSHFSGAARWLGVRVARGAEIGDEYGTRVPLVGTDILLWASVEDARTRIAAVEESLGTDSDLGGRDRLVNRMSRLREWIDELRERVAMVENSQQIVMVRRRMESLGARLDELEREGGRLDRIEDEVEDLVGSDGDVVDLNERMDRIEGRAPELIARLRAREAGPSEERLDTMGKEVERVRLQAAQVEQSLAELTRLVGQVVSAGPPTAESLAAVKRGGDVMTGGLVINRGGLEVLSGGVTCRGANVTTLEASNLIKAPKGILDALELRGDLTFDNTRRVVQCRMLEGRQGSARRDGALFLNNRGGAEVVIGNPEQARGAQVFGAVAADQAVTAGTSVAVAFTTSGEVEPGDVVRLTDDGSRVARTGGGADTRVAGIAAAQPGVLLGGVLSAGRVAVAVQGVTPCKVEADARPVRPGDLLVCSDVPGHARADDAPAPGAVLGKALGALESGRDLVSVLVWGR